MPVRRFHNDRRASPTDGALSRAGFEAARAEIQSWPDYAPTPLRNLPGLAAELGLARLWYKDEAPRFGLGSFKALGGAYAVKRVVGRIGPTTVAAATDGNHGRAVAWGATRFGCRCVIYVHEGVSAGRCDAIARYGAEIVRVPGTYDDSVRRCAADAEREGWTVVSDTAWPGYDEIPRDVMHGYGVLADETASQLGDARPSHVLVHAGVGAFAASVRARLGQLWPGAFPRFVVVEPERAACCLASAEAGRPTALVGDVDTIMAGLSCGEMSPLAWPILAAGADDFIAIADEWSPRAMRRLLEETPPVVSGETGAASIAALLALGADGRRALGIGADASVLVFGSEGATDPEIWRRITGKTPEEIAR